MNNELYNQQGKINMEIQLNNTPENVVGFIREMNEFHYVSMHIDYDISLTAEQKVELGELTSKLSMFHNLEHDMDLVKKLITLDINIGQGMDLIFSTDSDMDVLQSILEIIHDQTDEYHLRVFKDILTSEELMEGAPTSLAAAYAFMHNHVSAIEQFGMKFFYAQLKVNRDIFDEYVKFEEMYIPRMLSGKAAREVKDKMDKPHMIVKYRREIMLFNSADQIRPLMQWIADGHVVVNHNKTTTMDIRFILDEDDLEDLMPNDMQ